METIYLDHGATTRPADRVVAAMVAAMRECWANPSSIHRPGQAARARMEQARESVAALLHCDVADLVFTSGGTESANLALRGAVEARPDRGVLVTGALEHSAVRETAEALRRRGTEVVRLPAGAEGLVDLEALDRVLAERAAEIALVSVMWVNNETGVIQPVQEIGRRCREHGVPFHTDATQRVGKLPVDLGAAPIDLLGFSAHKFHGPAGAGALFVRRGVRIVPQIAGGPQERERRGGTENVPAIAGLGAAADLAREWLASGGPERQEVLRDAFEDRLVAAWDGAAVNGAGAPRSWDTTNVAFPGLEAEAILLALSERGVCASAGAACASGSIEPSPVLLAMGLPMERAAGSVRFGIGRSTTAAELDRATRIATDVLGRLGRTAARAPAAVPATRR